MSLNESSESAALANSASSNEADFSAENSSDTVKVLVIEDSRAFAMSVAQAIQAAHGFEVLIAYDYHSAQELLAQHKHELAVAIADLNLPDAKDGAAAELLAREGVPCIAFTGNFSPELRTFVHSVGVADYVLKKDRHDIEYVANMVGRLYHNRSTKLLIVDDRKSEREYLKAVLERQCYQVFGAESGEHALQCLAQDDSIRVVLVDLVMEGMDGFELLSEIRRRHDVTQMAIIGISGKASTEEIARFIKYGGNDFLLKPFEQEQVTCRVNSSVQMLSQFDRLNTLNEQKNELIGMAAHDIRSPLGVVLSAATMLEKEDVSERGKALLGLSKQSANQMMELLNSLLDMSAVQTAKISVEFEKILLKDVLERVAMDMSLMLEDKAQTLQLEIPPEPIFVNADKLRLKEVLENLLSNAIKYSQRGATIEMRLSSNVSHARIQVVDEAGGIPEDEQGQLFKAFCKISTKPTEGEHSTGLGLAICKRIVELHHGTIRYKTTTRRTTVFGDANPDSRIGQESKTKGSVFEVLLPLAD